MRSAYGDYGVARIDNGTKVRIRDDRRSGSRDKETNTAAEKSVDLAHNRKVGLVNNGMQLKPGKKLCQPSLNFDCQMSKGFLAPGNSSYVKPRASNPLRNSTIEI
jgi:hypothetical protein